jgi:hypothetical protein
MKMQLYEYFLTIAALGVGAADAIIRMCVAPTLRDNYIKQLLDVFVSNEKYSAPENSAAELHASDREPTIERNFA